MDTNYVGSTNSTISRNAPIISDALVPDRGNSPDKPTANTVIARNMGSTHVYAALGTDSTVTAVYGQGIHIPPQQQVSLSIGSNAYIAVIGGIVELLYTIV